MGWVDPICAACGNKHFKTYSVLIAGQPTCYRCAEPHLLAAERRERSKPLI